MIRRRDDHGVDFGMRDDCAIVAGVQLRADLVRNVLCACRIAVGACEEPHRRMRCGGMRSQLSHATRPYNSDAELFRAHAFKLSSLLLTVRQAPKARSDYQRAPDQKGLL